MIGKKTLNKIPYPIMAFLKELIICIVLSLFCCLFQNLIPLFISDFINDLAFDLSRFGDAVISLNFGLIFAIFLAIFVSDNSPFIQDARRHTAFKQPLATVIINSVLLCILSSFLPKSALVSWLLTIYECIIIASNIAIMWDLVTLSRKGQTSSMSEDGVNTVIINSDKEKGKEA